MLSFTVLSAYALLGMICAVLAYKLCLPILWVSLRRQHPQIIRALVSTLVTPIGPPQKTFEYLAPEATIRHLDTELRPWLDSLLDEIMLEQSPNAWENAPLALKNRMYAHLHQQLPRVLDDMIDDLAEQSSWRINYETLLHDAYRNNPNTLLNLCRDGFQPILETFVGPMLLIGTLVGFSVGLLATSGLFHWAAVSGFFVIALSIGVNWQINSRPLSKHSLEQSKAAFVESIITQAINGPTLYSALYGANAAERNAQDAIQKRLATLLEAPSIRLALQVSTGLKGYVAIKQVFSAQLTNQVHRALQHQQHNNAATRNLKKALSNNLYRISDDQFDRLINRFAETARSRLMPTCIVSAVFGSLLLALIGQI